ncbi:LOW QUALITY PROTEIN: desert hedgehog protein [Synchiropus picturatus]
MRGSRLARGGLLSLWTCVCLLHGCGPGPGPGYGVRPRARKLAAMHYKQFFPNFSENNLGASGRAEGKVTRTSDRFTQLVCNYNPDIVFKDEENTNADRFMTKRCKESVNRLAIAVMNQWPGVHLRVTEAWDEDGHHPPGSLHYEGRAVDITTDDRDTEKYGLLAQLAVEAGFDWVHYESKYHVHCSVKADHSVAVEKGGCFPGRALVTVAGRGQASLESLAAGESILALSATGQVVFSPVISFLHRDPDARSTFLSLSTDEGYVLTLTAQHLLFLDPRCGANTARYRARFASRAEPGACVLVHPPGGPVRASRIRSLWSQRAMGVFAPLTLEGTLFVDGVLASSYALVEDHVLAHWAFGPLRLLSLLLVADRLTPAHGQKSNTSDLQTCGLEGELQLKRSAADQAGSQNPGNPAGLHWYARFLYLLGSVFLEKSWCCPESVAADCTAALSARCGLRSCVRP